MTRPWTTIPAAVLGVAIGVSSSPAGAEDRRSEPVPSVLGDSGRDLVFTPVAPCRVIDTRLAGGRLTAGLPRDFDVAGTLSGQGGASDCLVPSGATAVAINLVAVSPDGAGNLKAWAYGEPVPVAAVINYGVVTGLPAIANGVVIPICNPALSSCAHDLTVRAASGVDLVADVAGYFSGATGLTVPWTAVTGKPAGFADGVDNDTQYTAGAGLTLTGTAFGVATGGVTSAMIVDGTIANADVSSSAAIAASKIAGTAAVLSFTGAQAFDTKTLVIDATAKTVGIGTTTPLSPLTVATATEPLAASAQIGHTNTHGLVLKRTVNDAGYSNLTLLKSRGDVLTPAQTGDGVGQVFFDVVDGGSVVRRAGEMRMDVVSLTPTALETSMSFEVHEGAPSLASVERLRVTSSGIRVTGNVVAEGGVRVGRTAPPGPFTSFGALSGATLDVGCNANNRGEIRVIEATPNVDWLCACLSLNAVNGFQWTCFRQ